MNEVIKETREFIQLCANIALEERLDKKIMQCANLPAREN